MKATFQNRWLIFALRLILGIIFIVAGIAKIQDIAKFTGIVASYGILSDVLTHIYSYGATWVELFIGCALILGLFVRFAAALSILMVLSFMVASSYALINNVGGSCGCFGEFLTLSHPVALTVDVLMLTASLILIFYKGKEFISFGQLIDRIHIKSNILSVGSRFALVCLAVVTTGLISIGIHKLTHKPYAIIETVSIPSPLSNDVDNALEQKKPVLLEFYAEGCSTCEETEPIIADMESKYINRITFLLVDYYQNLQAVSDMNIRTTPTVLVIVSKNTEGKYEVLYLSEGAVDNKDLQAHLEEALQGQ